MELCPEKEEVGTVVGNISKYKGIVQSAPGLIKEEFPKHCIKVFMVARCVLFQLSGGSSIPAWSRSVSVDWQVGNTTPTHSNKGS